MIIDPSSAYVMGCDYRVPQMHGLLDKKYIQEIKMSATYKDDSFLREYMAAWVGGSEASYFDYEKLNKYRVLKNPERTQKIREGDDVFYLIAVDVARIGNCASEAIIMKNRKVGAVYKTNIVNIITLGKTLETSHFETQALDLKKLIQTYNAREIVIDANGIGAGLVDFMIRPSVDPSNGEIYPAYGVFNDDRYKKMQPTDCDKIIYNMKANGKTNGKIHGNCYTRVNSGMVHFLIKETDAKNRLLSTKKGQKMTLEERVRRVYPHEQTTKLFDQMTNLRLKPSGSGSEVNLEQINKRYSKDKFSALEYGLWRIKELEDELTVHLRRRQKHRTLMFYSQGG